MADRPQSYAAHAHNPWPTTLATVFATLANARTIGSTNASGTPAYQVVLAGNTVVYRFNNTSATWVSGGNWYTLSGSSAISDGQVKAIVQHT